MTSIGRISNVGTTQNQGAAAAAADVSQTSTAKGDRLDLWWDVYADRALNMRQSEVRSIFSVVSRPEVVSLAGGMPNIVGLPLEFIASTTERIIREQGASALQYGSGQGVEKLREAICEVMSHEKIHAHADDIIVTTGSQQAIDLVTEILCNPGEVIIAEAPSYVGALSVFAAYETEVVHCPMDNDGIIPQSLEETIEKLKKQGKRVKFLYTIPNFHNPAGVTLSLSRRYEIIEICRRHHVLILEDNPYGILGFEKEPLPSLKSLDPEMVVYIGSFSKIFAPGYRVGWACAPRAVLAKLVLAQESAVLSPSNISQMSICEYLTNYDWFKQVKEYRGMYQERCQAALSALEKYLPHLEWTVPDGGFYTWITIPKGINARTMLPRAVTNLVAYTSGTAFYADGQGGDHLRISYCYPEPEVITEGVRRISEVIIAEQELVEMFGASQTK